MLGLLLSWAAILPDAAHAATATRVSAFEYNATSGLLTKEIVEPDQTQFRLETLYAYDAFGNKLSATVSSPATGQAAIVSRSGSNTYTSDGRFVATSTNALNHQETKQFDPYFGQVVSLTGPNNLTTTWTYDSFGRKLSETRADGTRTKWVYFYCAALSIPSSAVAQSAACPSDLANVKYFVEVNSYTVGGGGAETQNGPTGRVYYDILGREIRSESQGNDLSGSAGASVLKDTVYDTKARVQKVSRPYLNGTASGSIKWSSNTYDAIGRVTVETHPDNSTTQFTFTGLVNGTQVTATNSLNQARTTIKNSQAQVVQVKDTQNNATNFAYDPFGNLTKTTDSAGNVTTATFDVRGRKTAMVDRDMGSWGYVYNVLGDLVQQTDAKSQVATMAYDKLGRMTSRTEVGLTSTWTYDTATKGIGKLASAAASNGSLRTQFYDSVGRPWRTQRWIDQAPADPGYNSDTEYDANGRVWRLTYPSGFKVRYEYTALGFLRYAKNDATGAIFWQADTLDADGQLTQQTYGNGIVTTQTFDPNMGRLTAIQAGASNAVQNLSYVWDTIGNLTSRTDTTQSVTESFVYDTLNRVTSATIGANSKTVQYNAIGNITYKSDVGTYTYNASGASSVRPHAVASTSGTINTSFSYDANGNMVAGNGRSLTYTSFNMPATITRGATTISFDYDSEHTRTKQIAPDGTTVYIGPSTTHHAEKLIGSGGAIRWTNYIHAGGGMVGAFYEQTTSGGGGGSGPFYTGSDNHSGQTIVGTSATTDTVVYPRARSYYTIVTNTSPDYYGMPTGGLWFEIHQSGGGIDSILFTERAQFTDQTITLATGQPISSGTTTTTYLRYFHKDHLGSISVITNESGTVTERLAYDAWGKRRNINGTDDPGETITSSTDRGFTGHEHLEHVGLIHMNGRVYDPVIARFLTADPHIQDPTNTQSLNRYTYVLNNPLCYTDPSGFFFKKFFKKFPVVGMIVGLATAWLTGGLSFAMIAGQLTMQVSLQGAIIAGAVAGGLSGGIKGAIFGAISGAATFGIGQLGSIGYVGQALLHGASQGTLSVLQGGDFGPAFMAAAFSKVATGALGEVDFLKGNDLGSVVGKGVAAAVIGGTASVIGGGKFQNGAATAAFVYVFNFMATTTAGTRLGATVGCAVGGGAGCIAGAAAGAAVGTAVGIVIGDGVREDPDQYVIRGGLATPENLQVGTGPVKSPYDGLTGFSVTTAPNMSPEELAATAQYKNGMISITTVRHLAALGVTVIATPFEHMPLHGTAVVPHPLPSDLAKAISGAFSQKMVNRWQPER